MQHFKLATELKSEVKWAVTLQGVGGVLISLSVAIEPVGG